MYRTEESREAAMKSRFYCESCGQEVPFNAEKCSNCGKTFHAVKCPVCLFEAPPAQFVEGCPRCGYIGSRTNYIRDPKQGTGRVRSKRNLPPRWLYTWGAGVLLLLLLALLILTLQR